MKKYSVAETEKKVKKIFTIVCDTLELIVAVIVAIGVILAMLSLIPELGGLLKSDTGALTPFLEQVFTVVIGVEFLKMLCRPNSDNVFETIIFLVARHMIVNDTSPLEDLLSTVSIVLLCLVRRYLKRDREESREGRPPFLRFFYSPRDVSAGDADPGTGSAKTGNTEENEVSG